MESVCGAVSVTITGGFLTRIAGAVCRLKSSPHCVVCVGDGRPNDLHELVAPTSGYGNSAPVTQAGAFSCREQSNSSLPLALRNIQGLVSRRAFLSDIIGECATT